MEQTIKTHEVKRNITRVGGKTHLASNGPNNFFTNSCDREPARAGKGEGEGKGEQGGDDKGKGEGEGERDTQGECARC